MSMTHLHPALEAYAHAISMIDAVTGHQPSPLDGEHSSETEATPKQKMAREMPKHLGSRTSSHPKSSDVILHPRQPQGQLAICANVAINEVLQH